MTDERLGLDLTEWMKDAEFEPPDARRSARQVATRLPQTRQLGRRWWLPSYERTPSHPPTADQTTDYQPTSIPSANGHSPTVLGRTQSMFSPVKAITAGALIFAVGGAFLIAQPFDQQSAVPGAASDDPSMAPSFFTGTFGNGWRDLGVLTTETRPDGAVETVHSSSGQWRTNDPRINGLATNVTNELEYPEGALGDSPTGEVGIVRSRLTRVENDAGAWVGTLHNIQLDDPAWEISAGWLVGEGDYEGLMAYVVHEYENGRKVGGYITPDGAPPVPETFPEQ